MSDLITKLKRNLRYDWPLHFILLFTNWLPDNIICLKFRGCLSSLFFSKCGKNMLLGRNIIFYNPSRIVLGNNVHIASNCWFMAGEIIEIQDEVIIGPFSVIVSGRHVKVKDSYRWGQPIYKPITIERGSWLGSHVTVVGGVKIGRGVLVAANSVVTKNIADDASVGGTPAKPLHKNGILE